MEASISRLKIACSSASIPKAEALPSSRQTRRGVRGLTTTTAFEAVVFERESEVMNRNSYVPRPEKNLRTTDRGGYRGMAFFAESESERGAASAALRDPVRAGWRLALVLVSSVVLCSPAVSAQAQDISRANVGKWLDARPAAPPDFKAGDVLSCCGSRSPTAIRASRISGATEFSFLQNENRGGPQP